MNRTATFRRTVQVSLVASVLLGLATVPLLRLSGSPAVVAAGTIELLARDASSSLGVRQTFKHAGHVSVVAISPDSRHLAAGGPFERSISVWSLATGKLVHRLLNDEGSVSALAWSPDSTRLASGRDFIQLVTSHIAVDVWDVATGRRLLSMPDAFASTRVSPAVRKLAFSPDGTRIAAALSGFALYDATSGALVRAAKNHPAHGAVVAFSRDGRYLATSGRPRQTPIELLDPRTGASLRSMASELGMQQMVEFSPDSRVIASAGLSDRIVALWDVDQGRLIGEPLSGHTALVRALAFSADGRWLASLGDGDGIKIWGWRERRAVASVPMGKLAGFVLAFSPDGRWLVSAEDTSVQLRDFRSAVPSLLKELDRRGN